MICLVTGASGQDGSFLVEKLTNDKNKVHGLLRRNSSGGVHLGSLAHHTCNYNSDNFHIHTGDLLDSTSLSRVFDQIERTSGTVNEIYHMGAFTHVGESYSHPKLCLEVNTIGTLNVLEIARQRCPEAVIYHAATSELFAGDPETSPQDESTLMRPKTPYAASKLAAYNLCEFYKDTYDMRVVQGILFNHESERRPRDFVTMKVASGLTRVAFGLKDSISLGNLDSRRDWGYAGDYMDAVIKIVRSCYSTDPENYVVGTGTTRSIKELVYTVIDILNNKLDLPRSVAFPEHVLLDPRFMRKNEVWELKADASKIKERLNWEPQVSFQEMLRKMIMSELYLLDYFK